MSTGLRKPITIAILVVLLLGLTASVAFASGGRNHHRVRYGETLYSIGRYYGVSAHAIAKANNLYNPDYIYAGQKLYIPSRGYHDNYDGYNRHNQNNRHNRHNRHDNYNRWDNYNGHNYDRANYHRVHRGETLSGIAYRYGVSPWALARANNIHNMNRIYAGQSLYIPSSYY